jgi:hypothetical protein
MVEVAGNNLAAIVCSSELVRHGIPVRHISNQDLRMGGHFAGLLYQGKRIDLGMVLLEPRFDLVEIDIVNYQGQFGQEVNQFNQSVFRWLTSRDVSLNPIAVFSHFKNKLIGDAVIADDLSFLDVLQDREKQAIIDEISIRISESEHHPRDKAQSRYFQETCLRDVYYEIYGQLFSRYLLDNLELLAGPTGPELAGQFHRLLWSPLYYPETILNYLETGQSGIPVLDFFVPNNNSVSQLIANAIEEMNGSSNYIPQPIPNDEYLSLIEDRIRRNSTQTLVFADERELSDETFDVPGTKVAFVLAQIDSKLEFVVHNLDSSARWYRATARGQHLGICVIEVGKIQEHESNASILERANTCANSIGISTLNEPMILKSNIYTLTPHISTLFQNRSAKIKKILSGNPAFFINNETTGSFNNQVCLGLSTSQTIIRETTR